MIDKYDKRAVWHPKIYGDLSTIGASVKGTPFSCYEIEPKTNSQGTFAAGMLMGECTIALASLCRDLDGVKDDDSVEYGGYSYSVQSMRRRHSAAFYGAKEYIIYLK